MRADGAPLRPAPEQQQERSIATPPSPLAPFFVLRQDNDSEADCDADESLNGRPTTKTYCNCVIVPQIQVDGVSPLRAVSKERKEK